jgi:dTMP kinase
MRGALIVFEGIDRSGKSTQSNLLCDSLQPSVKMSFPNRETSIAPIINSYLSSSLTLDDHAIHLLFSANRWECKNDIINYIQAGTNVVLDRYAYSGVAYSAAKGLDFEWCKSCDAGLPRPDLIIYMKIDPQQAMTRQLYGTERYEKIEFQAKVAAEFNKLINNIDYCVQIDASSDINDISLKISQAVKELDLSQGLSSLW